MIRRSDLEILRTDGKRVSLFSRTVRMSDSDSQEFFFTRIDSRTWKVATAITDASGVERVIWSPVSLESDVLPLERVCARGLSVMYSMLMDDSMRLCHVATEIHDEIKDM